MKLSNAAERLDRRAGGFSPFLPVLVVDLGTARAIVRGRANDNPVTLSKERG